MLGVEWVGSAQTFLLSRASSTIRVLWHFRRGALVSSQAFSAHKKDKSRNMDLINIWATQKNAPNMMCSCCFYALGAEKAEKRDPSCIGGEKLGMMYFHCCMNNWIRNWREKSEKGTKHQQNLPPWINNAFYGRKERNGGKKATATLIIPKLSHACGVSGPACNIVFENHKQSRRSGGESEQGGNGRVNRKTKHAGQNF